MKNQAIRDLSYEDYAALKATSRTHLLWMADSPAHLKWRLDNPVEPTKVMELGVAIHTAVLETDRFAEEYAIGPHVNLATKKGKAEWEAFSSAHPGKKLLRAADGEVCTSIAKAVRNSSAFELLQGQGDTELSFTWKDEGSGLWCKGRADRAFATRDGLMILDLKSCRSSAPRTFQRAIFRDRLHIQAAFYLDGLSAATGDLYDKFALVAYEKTPPYWCSFHMLDDALIQTGREEYRDLLEAMRICMEKDAWPDYSNIVHHVTLPDWYTPIGQETRMLIE